MRGRQKRATVTGDMSGIERGSINFCRAPLQHLVAAPEIATRWHAARLRRAAALKREEAEEWFERRQLMLATSAELAASRRLSRFLYLAEKPIKAGAL